MFNYYPFLRKLLFKLAPETAHDVALKGLRCLNVCGLSSLFPALSANPRTVMGLHFPNPVGLAAGLDKNGDYIDALAALGFGFIEVGTVTLKPQTGNPLPRLFRLIPEEALINRMGFNNHGVDYLLARLKKTQYKGILGINIGKNRDTPVSEAESDYVALFRHVAPYASYVTVNISSPNTEQLRDLQHGELLKNLLHVLKQEQAAFAIEHSKYVPLVVKIAPDLQSNELVDIANIFLDEKIDGIIATNTTLSRVGVEASAYAKEAGGMSGKPVAEQSTTVIHELKNLLQDRIPIIGCGGISSGTDAQEKISAGASLLQVYTGFIYQGPSLLKEMNSIK